MPVAEGEWDVDDNGFASHVDGLLLEASEGTPEPVDHLQGVATAYAGVMVEFQFLATFFMANMLPQLLRFRLENYSSRSRFAGSMCRARLTGPATESDPVCSTVNATEASTNGSCAEAW
jgi:hypothetical protein